MIYVVALRPCRSSCVFFWVKTFFLAYPNKQPENKDCVKAPFRTHGAEICNEFANFLPAMRRERFFLRNTVPMYMDHLDITTRKTILCHVHVVKLQHPTHVATCIADRQLSGVALATPDRHYIKMHLQRKNAGLYTRARINRRLHRTSCEVCKECLESSGWTTCKPNLLATLYANLNTIPSKKIKIILILAAEVAAPAI